MGAVRAPTFGAHRLLPGLASTPGRSRGRAGPRRLQAGRRSVARSRAGRRGRGPQRREHLQNKDSGLDGTPPPPPPPPAPARPRPTQPSPSPPERRGCGPTRAPKPSRGPQETPEPRGPRRGHRYSKLLPRHQAHPPRPLCILLLLLFFKQPELSLSYWEGGRASWCPRWQQVGQERGRCRFVL